MISPTPTGLYLHIPFCRHRCGYCAFAISTRGHGDRDIQLSYLNALKKEFEWRVSRHGPLEFKTLYVGGGTPSRLHPDLILELGQWLDSTGLINSRESTFEINPEDLLENPGLQDSVKEAGFSRISLGVQTLSPIGLKILERQTKPDGILMAMDALAFPPQQLSTDFILGWPGQTWKDIKDDLEFIQNFRPGHISAYLLNHEPGTRLTKKMNQNVFPEDDGDKIGEHWNFFREELLQLGYQNYEISSFCLPGNQSEHNRSTWRGQPYLGIGSGAVSRLGKTRWTNHRTPEKYLDALSENKWPVVEAEHTGGKVAWQEALLLGCRHNEGLSLKDLSSHFSRALPPSFLNSWKKGIETGDLQHLEDRISFTPKGWSRFDAWISDWMLILEELD